MQSKLPGPASPCSLRPAGRRPAASLSSPPPPALPPPPPCAVPFCGSLSLQVCRHRLLPGLQPAAHQRHLFPRLGLPQVSAHGAAEGLPAAQQCLLLRCWRGPGHSPLTACLLLTGFASPPPPAAALRCTPAPPGSRSSPRPTARRHVLCCMSAALLLPGLAWAACHCSLCPACQRLPCPGPAACSPSRQPANLPAQSPPRPHRCA